MTVKIVGGGLAGVEAAWQLKKHNIDVILYEMKPKKFSQAHSNENLAELVCSNSLKSDRLPTASGMLKAEMELLDSLTLKIAYKSRVPAGGALAVDRNEFSKLITSEIENDKKIKVVREEVSQIGEDYTILAPGPLPSKPLSDLIVELTGQDNLSFYDAAAPILTKSSINPEKSFYGARYNKGDSDYLNCPMNENEYNIFYNELIKAKKATIHEFDKPSLYEGCMPIEEMAKRGKDTIRYGPLRPVGLFNEVTKERYFAVVQLRKEDKDGNLLGIVGFQTNLTFAEQKRVFSLIPALKEAEFVRYGVMHKNAFINSPNLLNNELALSSNKNIIFAGQITGVEGYMESAACGMMAGLFLSRKILKQPPLKLPESSMIKSLLNHLSNKETKDFQPMGANMGLLPPLKDRVRGKQERYTALSQRGKNELKEFLIKQGEYND